ncbi:MAG: DNA-directed RNA polymerase [Crenarchaeota archaeon]|nr:DNA-directed RNA polymerase [Thermoproteota archaeon]
MYLVAVVKDVVRIPPSLFDKPLQEAATRVLRERYEGYLHPELGIVVTVFDVKVSEYGRILPGDGATYHDAEFKILAFKPAVKEVVEGIVSDARVQGLFVNLGPIEGFIHKSQIMDDEVDFDPSSARFIGRRTRLAVGKNDKIRARVIAISLPSGPMQKLRVHMTMRQPLLGKIEWIKEQLKKMREG